MKLPDPQFTVEASAHIPIGEKVDYILQQGLTEYMKDKKPVWQRISSKYDVDPNAFDAVNFGFAGKFLRKKCADVDYVQILSWF